MRIILLGAPGAGKGTQAEFISEKLNIPTISTGLMIRRAIADNTEFGKLAKTYIDGGQLVPDEVIIELLLNRIEQSDCEKGYILDGFPRTINQAIALDEKNITIDKVLEISVPDETIVSRLSGRRECSKCGKTYHIVSNKPETEGKCDACGSELICRKDDTPEVISNRLAVYHKQTEPLITFYKEKGNLVVAEGQDSVADTTKEIFKTLGVCND